MPAADASSERALEGGRAARAAWPRRGGLCIEPRLAALGVPHGVSLRTLGDMKSAACRERALARGGLAGRTPRLLHQVHGKKVIAISAAPSASQSAEGTAREEDSIRADGWVSTVSGLPVAVYVADCLPIFLWDARLEAVAVLHAGWRGLAAGMPQAAVSTLRSLGFDAGRLCAAIGPHAGPCCYRVGPELLRHFRAESFVDDGEGGLRLDLGAEAKARFVEAGLAAGNVRVCRDCTLCSADDFFSFRRDKMDRRILAFIARP